MTAKTTPAQRWALALSALASFMVVLDSLVVSTALTTIRTDLHGTLSDLEWTVNAYTLTFAVLLMPAAALGGRAGRRRVFIAGLALFGLASAACALSTDLAALIAFRAVQGMGAAAVMPMALAVLNAAFPPERRGWAIGLYGSVTAMAVVLGPVVGGAVTQGWSWQWIFWLNVPLALGAIPLVATRIAEGFAPSARLDALGAALAGLAGLGLVWGLIHASTVGWSSPAVIAALLGGAVATAGFVAWERRAPAPMLPPRLFASRPFAAGNTVVFLLNAGLTAEVFFTAQLFQADGSVLRAGLRLLPWGIAPVLLAPKAGALTDRLGERPLVLAGMSAATVGFAWLAAVGSAAYRWQVWPLMLTGVGFALALPALTRAVVSRVAPGDIGAASGSFSTMRQLGGAFGVAIAGTAFAAAGGAHDFVGGYRAAIGVAALLGLVGLVAARGTAPVAVVDRRPAIDLESATPGAAR